MFKSFKALRTVRTLFDQEGNLYRMAKRVIHKITTRFADGFKIFAKNKLFYTEALPTTSNYMTAGAGIESVNQSQVTGLRSFSAYDIISTSGVSGKSLKFTQHGSSVDYPYATFDPDNSVGAAVFTKSLWNHNQLAYSEDYFTGTTSGYFQSFQSQDWTDTGETLMDGMKIFKYTAPGDVDHYLTTKPTEGYITYDDSRSSLFSFYIKADDNPSLRLGDLRVYFNDLTPETHNDTSLFGWGSSRLIPNTFYPDKFGVEDIGNGWSRITLLPAYFEWVRDTYSDLKSGDNLRFTILFNDVPSGGSVYLAGLQYEQHPISKPSWSHSQFSGYEQWVEGSGSQTDWNRIGEDIDNLRELRTDPFGKQSVVWVAIDSPDSPQNNHDGGFESKVFDVDTTKLYRHSLFMKVNSPALGISQINVGYRNTGDPDSILQIGSSSQRSNNQWAINWLGNSFDGTPLNHNEWYLLVYYLQPEGSNPTTNYPGAGVYDMEGNFIQAGGYVLYPWSMTSATVNTAMQFRVYNNPNNTGQEVELWGARVDEVDGNEPSIQDLLNPVDNPNYAPVTKPTPYVGNDGIPANVHRHNWLNYTEYLEGYNRAGVELTVSSIEDTLLNGERCYRVIAQDEQYPYISGSNLNTLYYDASSDYICSLYVKKANDNTYMPQINSDMSGFSKWTAGTGSITDWGIYGGVGESVREYRTTPYGTTDVIWVGKDLDTAANTEGGFVSDPISIDPNSNYRFSCWVKNKIKTYTPGVNSWAVYGGLTQNYGELPTIALKNATTGLINNSGYSHNTNFNNFTEFDQWHLYVSFIDADGTARGAIHPDAGYYDISGNKVEDAVMSFEFSSTCVQTQVRFFHYGNPSNVGDEVEFYHPRFDKLDGNEPSIERLISQADKKYPAINGSWVDPSAWSAGSGTDGLGELTDGGWFAYPDDEENLREYDTDPFGESSIIWKTFDSKSGTSPFEGGLDYGHGPIDPTKKYRLSLWMKSRNVDGDATQPALFFGPARPNYSNPAFTDNEMIHKNGSDGTDTTVGYFFNGESLPTQDEWYLAVGFIHPAGTATPITIDPDAGVYGMDGTYYPNDGGSNDYNENTFLFDSDNAAAGIKAFMYNNPSNAGDEAWFWGPRIDEVNGNEPSIDDLLRIHPGFRVVLQDYTAPASQAQALNINFNASGVPYTVQPSNDFHSEEVGDGWYRISDYAVANSNLVTGDQISPILYPFDSVGSWADTSSYATKEATYIMRPMIEIVAKDAPKLSPPTAYQRVSAADWPSVSAIPYHHVQKTIELTLDDETSPTNTYRAKAWWDGGQLYHYGNLSGNQEVAIEHIEDGWFKFRNSVKGLLRDEGAVEGDIASMTFGFGDYSGVPYGKALFSAPILANTGSEKSGEVNYSVGTTVPGKNDVTNIIDWLNGGPGYIVSGTEVSSISVVNHTTPNGTSAILVHTDEAGANRDDLWFESATFHTRASNYDTVVTEVPVKSLWNHNVLAHTRNIIDDPYWDGGVTDDYGSFYSTAGEFTLLDEEGPDPFSKVLSWTSPDITSIREILGLPFADWNWYINRWDENEVTQMSFYIKAPDDPSKTPTKFAIQLVDTTVPGMSYNTEIIWGPNQTPKEYNGQGGGVITVEGVGNGWYRVCLSAKGHLPHNNIYNGDKKRVRIYAFDYEEGQSFKFCAPQLEHHLINDTNLLQPAWEWYEVSGPTSINNLNGWFGYGSENGIELREDPFGLSSLCWVGYDLSASDPQDGGLIDSPAVSIDPNSTYRYSVFVKLAPETEGLNKRSVYFGPDSHSVADTDQYVRYYTNGVVSTNPYFCIALDEDQIGNDWVLLVAHIQPSGTTIPASLHPDTGIYAMDGTEISVISSQSLTDYLWDATTTNQELRVFAWGNTDNDGTESINIWSPRIEKVDGTEPSISELLASGNLWTNPNYQQTLPSPYVENVGVHPNPHRHNWLVATEDLDNTTYWGSQAVDITPSTVGTYYANGETCYEIVHTSSVASQTSLLYNTASNNEDFGKVDGDNGYIYSIYIKQHPTKSNGTDVANIRLYDVTLPQQVYSVDVTWSSIGAIPTISSQGTPTDYGIEELPDGWYRAWVYNDKLTANTVEGDRYACYVYPNGGGQRDPLLEGKGFLIMKPMLEIVPAGYTVNNVPRSYQAVDGEWDLGVTSIPEHQCAEQLRLNLQELDVPGTTNGASYNFSGGMLYAAPPQANTNTSVKYLGDGWYNAILSTSGTYPLRDEGDRFRLKIFPTEYVPDENRISYGMFAQPFMGMTGDVNTSSVDYNP